MTEPRKPCNVDSWGRCRTHGQYAYRCIDRLEAELSAVKAERDAWESLAQHISENEGVADKEEMNRQVERRVAKPDYKWFASDHESHSSGAGKGGEVPARELEDNGGSNPHPHPKAPEEPE